MTNIIAAPRSLPVRLDDDFHGRHCDLSSTAKRPRRDAGRLQGAVHEEGADTLYGAVVVAPQGPHLLTASPASPVVAQLLTQAAASQAPPTAQAVPATAARGAGFGAGVLPLALAGVAAGALVSLVGSAAAAPSPPFPAPPPSSAWPGPLSHTAGWASSPATGGPRREPGP